MREKQIALIKQCLKDIERATSQERKRQLKRHLAKLHKELAIYDQLAKGG